MLTRLSSSDVTMVAGSSQPRKIPFPTRPDALPAMEPYFDDDEDVDLELGDPYHSTLGSGHKYTHMGHRRRPSYPSDAIALTPLPAVTAQQQEWDVENMNAGVEATVAGDRGSGSSSITIAGMRRSVIGEGSRVKFHE